MFDSKDKLTGADRIVQRKMRDGQRLNNDDKRAVQARLRAMQKRHLHGMEIGIPSGAEVTMFAPRVNPAITAMNSTAGGMISRGQPDFGGKAAGLETNIRQLNGGSSTASFSFTDSTSALTLPIQWTVNGEFSLGALQYVSGGSGNMGGTTTTGGGGAGGNNAASGGSMGGSHGTGSGVSASVPVSGATVSGGTGNSSGVSGGISGGGANSTGTSGGGTANQGSSGGSQRETYMAPIVCNYRISWEVVMSWNPLSWGANIADEIDGVKRASGSSGGCGMIQFTVPAAG